MTTLTAAPVGFEPTLILAIDFDGTLVEGKFPKIGRDLGGLFWLSQLKALGCEMILWTCRVDQRLEEAIDWLALHGYSDIITKVNERADAMQWPDDPRKVFANFYVGDRTLGAPLVKGTHHYDWEKAGPMLIKAVIAERKRLQEAGHGS